MNKAEKRVEIAKDVLKQLKLNKITPYSGCWARFILPNAVLESNLDQNLSLKSIFNQSKKCETCAIGALFVSAIDKFNSLKLKDLDSFDYDYNQTEFKDTFSYLERFFSKEQLKLIEIAFELGQGYYFYNEKIELKKAIEWGRQYQDLNDRFRAIMLNIIRNKGEFIVPKRLPSRR